MLLQKNLYKLNLMVIKVNWSILKNIQKLHIILKRHICVGEDIQVIYMYYHDIRLREVVYLNLVQNINED